MSEPLVYTPLAGTQIRDVAREMMNMVYEGGEGTEVVCTMNGVPLMACYPTNSRPFRPDGKPYRFPTQDTEIIANYELACYDDVRLRKDDRTQLKIIADWIECVGGLAPNMAEAAQGFANELRRISEGKERL